MNKKLKFYSLLLAVAYIIFFAHNIYEQGKYGVAAYKFGSREIKKLDHFQILGGNVIPIEGPATFPTLMLNEKTGKEIRLEITEMMAFLFDVPENIPASIKIMNISITILNYVVILLFLIIPFIVYKIMKSISKNEFYSKKNIARIKKLSFVLLAIFAVALIANCLGTAITNAYMQLKDYTACVKYFNYSILFMGLVILTLSEILKYTKFMKEEQELTI